MEAKPLTTLKISKIIKYGSLSFAALYLFLLLSVFTQSRFYLQGNVRLGINDEHLQTFNIVTPFQHQNILFMPEHHFSMSLYWNEVSNENALIAHIFLKHLPELLAFFLAIFIFWKVKKDETLNTLFQLLTRKKLILVLILSVFLQNICRFGAEYCKIQFFKKYLSFQDAYWYLDNDVVKEELVFRGSISTILIWLFLFFYIFPKRD